MRKRIDPGNAKREIRVVLIGEPEAHGLDPQLEALGVAPEVSLSTNDSDGGQLLRRQATLDKPTAL